MSAQDRAIQKLAKELAGIKREVVSWRGPQADYTSIENGGNFTFKDSDGNVTAVAGGQDDGGTTINVIAGPTPPTPVNYTVTVDHGSLTVHWDGEFEDNAVAPTDWARWTAYAQPGEFVVPERSTAIGGTDSASGGEVTAGILKGQWTVTVLAWSQAGKPSAMGLPVTVDVPGYGEIVLEEIDAAETAIKNGSDILVSAQDTLGGKLDSAFVRIGDAEDEANTARTAADEAKSAAAEAKSDAAEAAGIAGGKADVLIQSSTPASSLRKPTTLWIDTTGGANTPKRWDGSGWVAVTDQAAVDAANLAAAAKSVADDAKAAADQAILDAALANDNANAALVSANGKNTVFYDSRPPTPDDEGIAGDSWFVGEVGHEETVLEENRSVNPSFEADVSGWERRWSVNHIAGTHQSSNSWGVASGEKSLAVTGGDRPSSSAAILQSSVPQQISAGEWMSFAASLRCESAVPVSASLRVYWLDSADTEIDSENLVTFKELNSTENSSSENRYIGDAVKAPAGAAAYKIAIWFRSPDGSDAPGAGFIAHIDDVHQATAEARSQTERQVLSYFDGDTPDGATDNDPHYRWTGEPHASTSEKYLPATDGLSENWNVVAQYRHDGTNWVEVELSHHVISSADVGKLVAGSATIKEAVVQKLFAEVVVARMSIADEFIGSNAILDESVTAPKIVASEELWAKIGEFVKIRAEQIKADAIDGKVITGATYRTSGGTGSWSDDGLFIAQPDGTSMVRFPTDGSPLSLTASDVQIDRASITDLDLSYGSVRSGGQVTLAAGVTAPVSPPELTTGWQKVATLDEPDVAHSYDWLGLGYWDNGTGWWVRAVNVLGAAGETMDVFEVYDNDGVFSKSIQLDINPRAGVTVIGDVAYTIGPDKNPANKGKQWVHGFDLNTGARVTRWEFTRFDDPRQAKTAIGNDGTNLLVAGAHMDVSRRLYVMRYNPATGAQVGADIMSDEWVAYTKNVEAVHISGNSMWVSHVEAVREFSLSGSTPTYTDNGWENPNKNGAGMVWRDGLPYVVDGAGYVYQGTNAVSDYTIELCYTWWDGAYETTPSGIASVVIASRRSVTVSFPKRAGLQKRLYMRQGTSGDWVREAVSYDDTSITVTEVSPFAARRPLPTTNTFPNADPATLKSTNNKFEVKGDGSGHWGPLTFNADGTMTSSSIPAWIPVTTFTGGAAAGTFGRAPAYRVWPDGKVEWRGIVAIPDTTGNTAFINIPLSATPDGDVYLQGVGNSSQNARIDAKSDSKLSAQPPAGGTLKWFSLDAIFYYTS